MLLAAGAQVSPLQAQNEGKSVLGRPADTGSELSDPTEADIIRALKPLPRTTRGLGGGGGGRIHAQPHGSARPGARGARTR
jgi:hypothetical protein